jgi:diguanylate cyclase (GGDEF)-like protein
VIEPQLPPDEATRIETLRRTRLLDSPIEERFERITRLARRVLHAPIAAISLVDAHRQFFKSIQGLDVCETSRAISFCGHAILSEEALIVPDARKDERFADNPLVTGPPHIVFYAGCPISAPDGSRLATMCVIGHTPRRISPEEVEMLEDLAALAEMEVQRSFEHAASAELLQEIERLQQESKIDGLTRLWNREAILDMFTLEAARQRELVSSGVGIILADIDHFKQINDLHGHPTGDEVLREAARRALRSVRRGDHLGRYGGEEFMIVLGHPCDAASARAVAENVRRRFESRPFIVDGERFDVTMSLGVAVGPEGTDADTIVQHADEALYRAKDAGRNRVEMTDLHGRTTDQRNAA